MAHETWPLIRGGVPFEPYGALIDEWLFDDEAAGGGTTGAASQTIPVPTQSASGRSTVTGQVTNQIAVPAQTAAGWVYVQGAASQLVGVGSQIAVGTLRITGVSGQLIEIFGTGVGGSQATASYPQNKRSGHRRQSWRGPLRRMLT